MDFDNDFIDRFLPYCTRSLLYWAAVLSLSKDIE